MICMPGGRLAGSPGGICCGADVGGGCPGAPATGGLICPGCIGGSAPPVIVICGGRGALTIPPSPGS